MLYIELSSTIPLLYMALSSTVPSDKELKLKNNRVRNLISQWPVYVTNLEVNNLFQCFTFPPMRHTVSFETKSPVPGNVIVGAGRLNGLVQLIVIIMTLY